MYLVVIYPKAQPPYYDRPTDPVKAYLLNGALDRVVDKAQGPWASDGIFEAVVDPLCAKHGFERTWQNFTLADSLAEGAQYFERGQAVANYLTPQVQARLLALLDQPKADQTAEQDAQDEAEICRALAETRGRTALRAAELKEFFKGQ